MISACSGNYVPHLSTLKTTVSKKLFLTVIVEACIADSNALCFVSYLACSATKPGQGGMTNDARVRSKAQRMNE